MSGHPLGPGCTHVGSGSWFLTTSSFSTYARRTQELRMHASQLSIQHDRGTVRTQQRCNAIEKFPLWLNLTMVQNVVNGSVSRVSVTSGGLRQSTQSSPTHNLSVPSPSLTCVHKREFHVRSASTVALAALQLGPFFLSSVVCHRKFWQTAHTKNEV